MCALNVSAYFATPTFVRFLFTHGEADVRLKLTILLHERGGRHCCCGVVVVTNGFADVCLLCFVCSFFRGILRIYQYLFYFVYARLDLPN